MSRAKVRRLLTTLCVVLVALDLAYSGYQYYVVPLDGDLGPIVAPAAWYRPVLDDPLGLAVLLRDTTYAAPNRYFAHATMGVYFRHVPLALQLVVAPLDSVYVACALFKLLLHVGLLFLLAWYAGGGKWRRGLPFWLTVALLAPLFQTYGFSYSMAVIDGSTTYCFFYALPLLLLLVWLRPFYRAAWQGEPLRVGVVGALALGALALYLALHGPVAGGAVGVLFPGIVLAWLVRQLTASDGRSWPQRLKGLPAQVPWPALGLLSWFGVLVLYSLYIGRNNSENLTLPMTLAERYELLWAGVADIFCGNPGQRLLGLALLISAGLLRWRLPATPERQRLLRSLGWLSIFAVVYVVLTPLGGYRPYRPHILRYDVMIPVTLPMMALYAAMASHLLLQLTGWWRHAYLAAAVGLAGVFWYVDMDDSFRGRYLCEHHNLKRLANATEPLVKLPPDCAIMAWTINDSYSAPSNAELLYYWGVTKTFRRYYQPPQ